MTLLVEYLLKGGMPLTAMFDLNVFGDILGISAAGDRGQQLSNQHGFRSSRDWKEIERSYKPIASQLRKEIQKRKNETLTDDEAKFVEGTWLDDHELYEGDDIEMAIEVLPSVFDEQIAAIRHVIKNHSIKEQHMISFKQFLYEGITHWYVGMDVIDPENDRRLKVVSHDKDVPAKWVKFKDLDTGEVSMESPPSAHYEEIDPEPPEYDGEPESSWQERTRDIKPR